ncbi:mitochondrial carrier [Piedraia hortae CBS 480.64]|uniref:Mitochondrial carrier n=1 Tax=Piedraia hortae CBS 480.64 TaxID=1314780 RepID=A0A6A7C4H4_9PEZI|nr:mitochondrial carrier [Piedraia hortae CBS 480.64]
MTQLIEPLSGLTAGLVSTLAVHPFDVIKTRMQLGHNPNTWTTTRDILTESHGLGNVVRNLYRGIAPNLLGNSVSWGLYFLFYARVKDGLASYRHGRLTTGDFFVSSAVAGLLTSALTNPIWVLKTRILSTSRDTPGAYASMMQGARVIYSREGVRGFYRGLVPSLFGVAHGAVQFVLYERFKEFMARHGEVLGNMEILTASAASKIFASAATYPYQVIRARLQAYDAERHYTTMGEVVRKVWRQRGLRGFYAGLVPSFVRVLPSTCVTFLVYENTRYYLHVLR